MAGAGLGMHWPAHGSRPGAPLALPTHTLAPAAAAVPPFLPRPACPALPLSPPQVKNKMSKADFLRNNRGINDGGDLAQEFMEALYDRIIHNEIKMKDDPMALSGADAAKAAAAAAAGVGWLDTIMNLIPGRAKAASAEPNDEAIRRTHEHLRRVAWGVEEPGWTRGRPCAPWLAGTAPSSHACCACMLRQHPLHACTTPAPLPAHARLSKGRCQLAPWLTGVGKTPSRGKGALIRLAAMHP